MTAPSVLPAPPLDGLRVIELGQLIAGPFCGQILADFGAQVIKIEEPKIGDPMRRWGQLRKEKSLSWAVIARGKRCITADLRTEAGQLLVRDLIAHADVVLENFRPGTMEKYNLGWDVMSSLNPRVILIRVSGFGQDGPYARRPGYGSIGEAMGGLRYLIGDADRPPSRVGVSMGDLLAGVHAALGALLALQARSRTGRGQVVDVSIYESVLAMSESLVSEYAVAGFTRERSGPVLPGVAPSNVYATADGQQLLVAANQDTVFRRLALAMNMPWLADDPDFADHRARGDNQERLDQIISDWLGGLEEAEALTVLEAHAVPVGRLYRARDMLADPQFIARDSIISVEDAELGPIPMQAVTPRLSETPGCVRWPGPALGEHDNEVRQWLADWPNRS